MRTRGSPLLALLLASVVVGSCVDAPTAPRRPVGNVALAPRFAHAVAAGIVDVAAVRVTLSKGIPPRNVVDTVVFFSPAADSISLLLSAPIAGNSETFELRLAMVNAQGDTVFRAGPTPVTLSLSPQRTAVEPELRYSGPGATASSVRFVDPPAAVTFGQSVALAAEALDAQQQPIAGTPIGFALADSADTLRGAIPDPRSGVFVAGTRRGNVTVRAFTPTDLGATHVLAVQPVATALRPVSGDGQIGEVSSPLAQPLVVQVIADDSLGVAGAAVAFAVTAGGATLTDTAVVSDANGNASTSLVLGATPGAVQVSATLVGTAASPIVFTATATAGPPTQLAFTTQPVSGSADAPLAAVRVSVLDANGFVVDTATSTVSLALAQDPTGQNPLAGTLSVAAVNGVATFTALNVGLAATGYRLSATAAGLAAATSAPFDVTPGAATTLEFVLPPPGTVAALTPFNVEVVARDAQGNAATGFAGTVTLALGSNPSAGALSGPQSVSAVAGVASFVGVSVDNLGTGYTLQATASGLTAAASNPFNVQPPPEVNAWLNTAGGNWNVAANWSRGTVPTATDTVWIRQSGTYTVTISDTRSIGKLLMGAGSGTQTLAVTAGTVTLADTAQLQASTALVVSGGQLTGGGLLVSDGSVTWSGGNLQNGGGTLRVGPTGTLQVSGTASRFLSAFRLELAGTGTWTDTHLVSSGNAAVLRVLSGATLEIRGDATLDYNFGGTQTLFENQGTVIRSTSAGTFTTDARWVNTGDLQVNSGSMLLSGGGSQTGTTAVAVGALLTYGGGTHTVDAASSHAVAGRVVVTAGTVSTTGPMTGVGHVFVNGGFLTYNAAGGTVDSLSVFAGRLGGSGLLTVGTRMEWNGGDLQNGGGAVRVAPAASLLISGTASRFLSAYRLEVAGAAAWTGTHLVSSGNAAVLRVLAGGTLDIQGDATLDYNFGGVRTAVDNQGTITRSTSTGAFTTDAAWNNSGDVQVSSGSLVLSGGGTQSGTLSAAVGTVLRFAGGAHVLGAGSALASAGLVELTAGSVAAAEAFAGIQRWNLAGGTLTYDAASGGVDTLIVSGGRLTGAGLLTVGRRMEWTGGDLQNGGGTVRVASAATALIGGTAGRFLSAYSVEVAGAAAWTGTHLVSSGNAAVLRVLAGATLDIQGDATLAYNFGGVRTAVDNQGTITRSTSAGAFTTDAQFINSGELFVNTGTVTLSGGGTQSGPTTVATGAVLQFGGGVHTLGTNAVLDNNGRVNISAGTVSATEGWLGPGRLALLGGTVSYGAATGGMDTLVVSGGAIGGPAGAVFTVGQRMEWTGGAVQGTGGSVVVASGAALDVSGTGSRSLVNALLQVNGTATWRDAHTLNAGSGGILRVAAGGTLDIQGDPTMAYSLGGATPAAEFLGAVTRSGSAGNVTLSLPVTVAAPLDIQTGAIVLPSSSTLAAVVTAAFGSELLLAAGSHTMQAGFAARGAGQLRVSGGTLGGLAAGDTAVLERVTLAGGNVAAAAGAVVRVDSVMTWTGGNLTGGRLHVPAAALLTTSGTAARSLSASTLDVFGTMRVTTDFTLNTGAGAQLFVRPGGRMEMQQAATTTVSLLYSLGGAAPLLTVEGNLRLVTNGSTVLGLPVVLSGTATVDAGTLNFSSSGSITGSVANVGGTTLFNGATYTLGNGAAFTGTTTFMSAGTLQTAAAGDTARFTALNQTGGALAQSGRFEIGALTWSGGSLSGTGTTVAQTTLDLSGTAARTFTNGRLLNLGSGSISGAFTLNSGAGARLVNSGSLVWSGDGAFAYNQGGAQSVFENLGTFSRLGALPTSVATISAYVIDTLGSGFAVNAGELHLTGGARLGGSPYLGGVLQVSANTVEMQDGITWASDGGLLRLAAGTLTADAGSVIVMPDLVMTGGVLSHSGTLQFGGTVDWAGGIWESTGGTPRTEIVNGGALTISGAAAKTLSADYTIAIDALSSATLTGSGAVNTGGGAQILNAGNFDLAGPGSILYNLGGAVPVFENAATGTLVSSGAVTGVLDMPVRNLGGALVVTGDSLRLTRGSTAAFAGTATVNTGALVLGGGTFTATGALSVTGTAGHLAVRGGAFNLNGQTVTVAGNFSTQGTGVLESALGAALLTVSGNASFTGGASAPSAGTLDVGGNFTQGGATNAFAPTGTFLSRLTNTANTQTVTFANPGTSFFRRLHVLSGERGVQLASNVVVNDSLVLLAGAWNYDVTGVGGSERLSVVGGLRIAQATGSPRLAPPVLELTTAPSVPTFVGGTRGMAPDTTVYVGATVTSLPANSGIRYNSVRLANGQIVTIPSDTIAGDLHVSSGRASFSGAVTFRIGGKLRTTGTGALGMSNAAATVTVVDSAVFAGGSTSGLLTAGLLRLSGAFVQEGTTTSAFRATGSHRTAFIGAAAQRVRMNDAGSAVTSSRFQSVELGTPTQAAALNLETPIFAGALRDTTATLTDELATSVDALITVDSASLSSTRFNGVRLAMVASGVFQSMQSLTFTNMNPTLTYLQANVNDITVVTLNGVNFQTTATTGYYVHVNQVANPLGGQGAVSLVAPVTPTNPLGRYLRTTTTGILPNVIWLGVTNP